MPLFQYFGWVGSVLLAALLAKSWCVSAPIGRIPELDVARDQKISIRIHTDHKWPERVVFDTTSSAQAHNGGAEIGMGESKSSVTEEHQPLDAFAAMDVIPVRPCFRPPCSAGEAAERKASGAGTGARSRSRFAVRKDVTFPNRFRRPPGKN